MSAETIRSLPIWRGAVRIEALGGGITNQNWLVADGAARFVAREGRDDPLLGISRRNEIECARLAARDGIAPDVVYAAPGIAVFDFVDGTPLTSELLREPARIARVAERLRRIHAVGDDAHALLYFCPFHVTAAYVRIAESAGLRLPTGDPAALRREIEELRARTAPFRPTFCHNDLMPGNLIDAGSDAAGRIWVIDWEYAGFGNPYFDLAGLASNCELGDAEVDVLLTAYFGQRTDADARELRIQRAVAALRESLWGVVQGSQSEIDFDYDAYRDDNYGKYRRIFESL